LSCLTAAGVGEFSGGRIVSIADGAEGEIAAGLTGKMSWKALNGAASLTVAGAAQGQAFSVDASSASALLFMGGAATPVKMEMKLPSANFAFNGTANLGENPLADGRVSFSAPSVRKILQWSGAVPPHTPGAITVESRVMGDAERLRFEDDGKPAHGALDLLLTGKLPTIAGNVGLRRRVIPRCEGPSDAAEGFHDGSEWYRRRRVRLRRAPASFEPWQFMIIDRLRSWSRSG